MYSTSCSMLEKIIYHPDVEQGNYLIQDNIDKIHVGMTKKQIYNILGMPSLKDPFGSNVWYYIFRLKLQQTTYQVITLIFSAYEILEKIDYN